MALVVVGCRSSAPVKRPTAPTAQGLVDSYVGQTRILFQRGDQKVVSLQRKELAAEAGGCDVGVEVREAALDKGVLRFRLERLGAVNIQQAPKAAKGRKAAKPPCGAPQPEVSLTIAGFDGPLDAAALEADVVRILATPEAFLTARGYAFPSGSDDPSAPIASNEAAASLPEQNLWRQVTVQPKPALRIDPDYRDPGGKVRHQGEVEFSGIVGTDGRLRDVRLKTPLVAPHDDHVLRALKLWRYEPGARKEGPVPVRINGRLVFRIY
jgi:TonB family protein